LRQRWQREQQDQQSPCGSNRESLHSFLLSAASLTCWQRD
jgi:hypothetical protein